MSACDFDFLLLVRLSRQKFRFAGTGRCICGKVTSMLAYYSGFLFFLQYWPNNFLLSCQLLDVFYLLSYLSIYHLSLSFWSGPVLCPQNNEPPQRCYADTIPPSLSSSSALFSLSLSLSSTPYSPPHSQPSVCSLHLWVCFCFVYLIFFFRFYI